MSRIGKLPIAVPSGVDVAIDQSLVTVKGPKGTLSHTIAAPITIERVEDGTLEVRRPDDERISKSLHGLTRTLIANMVVGVTDGYEKKLEIVGVGYRAELKGQQTHLALGYSHPVIYDVPKGIDVAIEKQTHITVTGVDRQLVGQVAANLRRLRKPDPYQQKGVRYTGEVLKKKAGKTGA